MTKKALVLAAAAALVIGGMQALAAAGVPQADLVGVVASDHGSPAGKPSAANAPQGKDGRDPDGAKAGVTANQAKDDGQDATEAGLRTGQGSGQGPDKGEQDAEDKGAGHDEATAADHGCADKDNHGCEVSKAVHAAQQSTRSGSARGIAVSIAAHNANCSTLPAGAQAACVKKQEHPNADGEHGRRGSGE